MKCDKMVSHVCSVDSKGRVKWSWSQEQMKKVKGWESVMMRKICQFQKKVERLEDLFLEKHIIAVEPECKWDEGGSHQLDKLETLVGAPQQRRCVGYGDVEMARRERTGGKKEEGFKQGEREDSNKAMLVNVKLSVTHQKKNTRRRRREEMGRNREECRWMNGR